MKGYTEDKIRPSFNANRVFLGEVVPLDAPFSIIIDISDICNLKCNYCFRVKDNTKEIDGKAWGSNCLMTWQVFCRVLDQIEEFSSEPKKIGLSGHGEPLVNRRLPDMVREIKKRFNSVVEIHTNATLLTKEYAEDLAASKIDKVIVSLQGMSSAKYHEVCGYGLDFEVFCVNLQYFYDNKRDTEINIKIADIALEQGGEEAFFEKFAPIADGVYVERTVPIWESIDYSEKVGGDNVGVNKFGKNVPYVKCCSIMFYTILVTPLGQIYPCTQAQMTYSIGDVHSSTLLKCWGGNKRRHLLLTHLESGRAEIADCKNCYVVENSILTAEDIVDGHSEDILARINCKE